MSDSSITNLPWEWMELSNIKRKGASWMRITTPQDWLFSTLQGVQRLRLRWIFFLPSFSTSRGEPIKDTARVLGSDMDGIVARVFAHDTVYQLSVYSGIPVIDGLSDFDTRRRLYRTCSPFRRSKAS